MLCPSCKAQNDPASDACFKCGMALSAREPAPAPVPEGRGQIPSSQSSERRAESRLEIPISVKLRWGDAGDAPSQEEHSVLDSISRHGARVMTAMAEIAVGDELALEEIDGGFTARAVVKNAYCGSDNIRRLGLQLLDQTVPDRLLPSLEEAHDSQALSRSEGEAERRSTSRLEMPLEVLVARVNGSELLPDERTLAENISRGGARVVTADPSISSSDVVLFREVGGDFQTRAEVRHVYAGEDHIRRLNLKFLDRPAPDRLAQTNDRTPSTGGLEAAAPPADTQGDGLRGLSREEIQEAYTGLRQRDHFALLGVPRDADTETINAAYARLAGRYSSDAHRDRNVSDLFREIGAIRLKLGEAHEVLSEPSRRADYERSLGLSPDVRRPEAAARADAKAEPEHREPRPDDAAPTTTPAAKTDSGEMAALETAISEGRRLLKEGEPWEAIQVLEGTVRRTQGKSRLRHKALVLLAESVSQNPKWLRRAEGLLKEVIEEDPVSVQAHLQLAMLYKSAGLARKAMRAFRRVIELDPGNKVAQAELATPANDRG